MKQTLNILLMLVLLFSCKSKTKETSSLANNGTKLSSPGSFIESFKHLLHGVWVKSDYIKMVIKSKSPYSAIDLAEGLTTMHIDTSKIKGDSLIVPAGINNHEADKFVLRFKQGKSPGSIQFAGGELSYSINNKDTVLLFSKYNNESRRIEVTRYIKALNSTDPLGSDMDYLINKNLFSGSYAMSGSDGQINNVKFSDDGEVIGLPKIKTYYVLNDFIGDPMDDFDQVIFNLYGKNQQSYAFVISSDTIKLYDTKPNADSTKMLLYKLKYTLNKIK
jgi:hypothetical protein